MASHAALREHVYITLLREPTGCHGALACAGPRRRRGRRHDRVATTWSSRNRPSSALTGSSPVASRATAVGRTRGCQAGG
jgi:hypothetical protein